MQSTGLSKQAQAALAYAEQGWPVFPLYEITEAQRCACGQTSCAKPGKHPRTLHGFKDATTAAEEICRWWQRWPCANLGIRTGRESGVVALDIDPQHDGDESLAILEVHHQLLPETVRTQTGGGGQHFLFAHPGDREIRCTTKLGGYSGLDVRGDGGYIVVPPSNHASGTP